MRNYLLGIAVLALGLSIANGQGCVGGSCFPSTGDLLVGRGHMLHATSTCGLEGRQTYCIVSHLSQEQKCFECDASVPLEAHPVQNVITTFNDRLETWWQAQNGKQKVSIQLNLEAEFQFTHLIMTFKTFRPAAMFIERSLDFGKTWAIYRYFAYDCDKSFPGIPHWPPLEIDDVICEERYSQIEPSNQGEVIYRVLEPYIPIEDPYAPRIQNLLKITNLRINFTELHTLGDDLLDHRQDIKNKYYYSLYELIVRGNCFCYGHAEECTPLNGTTHKNNRDVSEVMVHGRCQCQHNTVGLNCEQCLPFYHDQPWRPAESDMPHECKPCNCNDHATECHFDPAVYEATGGVSGGVCDNCQDNTVGRNCEQCVPYFYKDPLKDIRDPTVCAPCDCEVAGSLSSGICDGRDDSTLGMIAGQCRCKRNVEGPRCDRCKPGFYNLDGNNPDGCTACDCDSLGTASGANTCDPNTGQCICKRFTTGRRCDMCVPETWGMSAILQGCNECDCDVGGSYDNDCDQTNGQCNCRTNIDRRRCDHVISGNFLPGLDHYVFEAEDADIKRGGFIEKREHTPPVTWTGDGFVLMQEDGVIIFTVKDLPRSMDYNLILRYQSNLPDMWQYLDVSIDRPNQGNIPTSSPCGNTRPDDDHWMTSLPGPPTTHSSLGIICLESNYTYKVILDFRRYQRERRPDDAIPDILIDSLVVVPVYSNLEMFYGTTEAHQRERQFTEMECQEGEMFVPDRKPHEECAGLLFSMSSIIHDGAQPCDCDPQGSESSICESWGGQCRCKRNVIGRRCNRCAPGTYGFGPTGCSTCDCDLRGSRDQFCDPVTGQCPCEPGVGGRRCGQCKVGHYRYPECLGCMCNGHADTCDQTTGVCIGCRDHTMGDHCDVCVTGYYGNPLLGSLDQCRPCLCPEGPGSSRQFASGCRQDPVTRQVTCYCLPGYDGRKCDRCAPAYWGNPQQANGLCRECECNGNIDQSDRGACDADTGVCTGCLYDTAGPHCERCRDFYFGSAFDKTCRACACSILGTDPSQCVNDQCHCDVTTGQCQCLPNVVGTNCDQCRPNYWHIASGVGCEPCDCNLANSQGPSCNEITGQCQCNEGFGGRTCNDCADGHFGNPNIECFACECNVDGSTSTQCNPATGQCDCVEGVGGRRCDRCLRGFTGQVPNCEACGECFNNWDHIINQLIERTDRAISDAERIGETGITGIYDDEFGQIEEALNKQPKVNSSGGDDVQNMIDLIKNKTAKQQNRLTDLERSMDEIRDDDKMVTDGMADLENRTKVIQDKLDILREQKQNISRVSPVAAFKQVEDSAADSAKSEKAAQAATTEPGSLVNQSQQIRAEVKAALDGKKMEFDDKLSQVEADLKDRRADVDALTLSELNKDVCGAATEGCDDTCGGAGCETCGGIDCHGAVTFAQEAKNRAQKIQENLNKIAEETGELGLRVQVTKANAHQAKTSAQAVKALAQKVEKKIREKNSEIRNLIQDIRSFLADTRADPKKIEEMARNVIDLSLPITRDEIDQLAADIRKLSGGLPNVDEILENTQGDLERANKLLADANKAKASASAVAGDAKAVVSALAQAENASNLSEAAKDQAASDITKAEKNIAQINDATQQIANKMMNISRRLKEFQTRLSGIERQMSENELSLQTALGEAERARTKAQSAVNMLEGQSDLINEATDVIKEKKGKTDRLESLRNSAQQLATSVAADLASLNTISTQFNTYEAAMIAKNNRLDELLRRANQLYTQIQQKEEFLRTC